MNTAICVFKCVHSSSTNLAGTFQTENSLFCALVLLGECESGNRFEDTIYSRSYGSISCTYSEFKRITFVRSFNPSFFVDELAIIFLERFCVEFLPHPRVIFGCWKMFCLVRKYGTACVKSFRTNCAMLSHASLFVLSRSPSQRKRAVEIAVSVDFLVPKCRRNEHRMLV